MKMFAVLAAFKNFGQSLSSLNHNELAPTMNNLLFDRFVGFMNLTKEDLDCMVLMNDHYYIDGVTELDTTTGLKNPVVFKFVNVDDVQEKCDLFRYSGTKQDLFLIEGKNYFLNKQEQNLFHFDLLRNTTDQKRRYHLWQDTFKKVKDLNSSLINDFVDIIGNHYLVLNEPKEGFGRFMKYIMPELKTGVLMLVTNDENEGFHLFDEILSKQMMKTKKWNPETYEFDIECEIWHGKRFKVVGQCFKI